MFRTIFKAVCVALVVTGGYGVAFAGSILTYDLNTDFYSEFNAELLRASQGDLTTTTNFDDISYLMNFDAIFLFGNSRSSLTDTEIENLASYIASGRRIVLTGEGAPTSAAWNSTILGLVGGSSVGVDQHAFVTPIYSHQLTANIDQVNFYAADQAVGGVQLFSENVATLWESSLNVLTILDGSMWAHVDGGANSWAAADNAQFGINVANWLGGTEPEPVPEPSTMLLLSSGIFVLAGRRLGKK